MISDPANGLGHRLADFVAADDATPVGERRAVRARRASDGGWDADEVAEHLMACEREMVLGLARRSPWIGLDEVTQASCYGHAVAVVARIAASRQRPEWRRPRDLEKAQVAAYRNQALEHWRRVNAHSRRGDRFAVLFDPERHSLNHSPIDALFEPPDLHAVESDLLAELVQTELRDFWTIVLREQVEFKVAGDRLGLTKAGVIASTRAGRTAFASYLERRATGELCAQRGADIEAHHRGAASSIQSLRARAHLESCYVCALAHEPRTNAFQRGILALSPLGLVLRLTVRASEAVSAPATRVADAGAVTRAVAAGVAALTVAGSSFGVVSDTPERKGTPTKRATVHAQRFASVGDTPQPAPPPPVVEPVGRGGNTRLVANVRSSAPRRRRAQQRRTTRPTNSAPHGKTEAALAPQPPEFDIEHSSAAPSPSPAAPTGTAASATRSTSPPSSAQDPATAEFPTP